MKCGTIAKFHFSLSNESPLRGENLKITTCVNLMTGSAAGNQTVIHQTYYPVYIQFVICLELCPKGQILIRLLTWLVTMSRPGPNLTCWTPTFASSFSSHSLIKLKPRLCLGNLWTLISRQESLFTYKQGHFYVGTGGNCPKPRPCPQM